MGPSSEVIDDGGAGGGDQLSDEEQVIDALIENAHSANRDSNVAEEHARIHRARRDVFVRRLYATKLFSYPQLAELVGVSPELIAKIVQGRTEKRSVTSKRK
jgi:hypothetical protein